MKKINVAGIFVGLIFLGLAVFFYNGGYNGGNGTTKAHIFFFLVGLFFIYKSLRGESNHSIFHTSLQDLGVSHKIENWYFKLMIIAVVILFIYIVIDLALRGYVNITAYFN